MQDTTTAQETETTQTASASEVALGSSETKPASSEETQGDETLDASDASDAKDGGEETKDGKEGQRPKRNGFQKKIDKLTKARAEAQRELEYWREQALRGQAAKPGVDQPEAKAQKSDERPQSESFETLGQYYEALADWKYDQREKERTRQAEERALREQAQKQTSTFQERVQTFSQTVSDFEETIEDVDDIPMSVAVQQALLESENGPELMYQLAKNRAEYERICKLPASAAYREIGRFEARLEKKQETKPETQTTKAPEPIKPISAKTAPVRKSISDEDLSFEEYVKLRRDQMRKKA